MSTYKAYYVEEYDEGFKSSITELPIPDLESDKVIIQVNYSSLNYKDALSASGNKGVTKVYPFVPGIDAVGTIYKSSSDNFKEGDEVIVTGYDMGMNTHGGFGEYIQVPSSWVVALPPNLSKKEAISFGTAGLTAAASVDSLPLDNSLDKPVVVTGATGGVGCISIGILSKLGVSVAAITGKPLATDFLNDLGASSIIMRDSFVENDIKPLDKSEFSHAIDTVGGEILARIISKTDRHAVITCCGNVNSMKLNTTVFPFILRGIILKGIDSAEAKIEYKEYLWKKLSSDWKINMNPFIKEISLNKLDNEIQKILSGQQQGRIIIKHGENV